VHDEVLAEHDAGSIEDFKARFTASQPAWADGLPLVASAWSETRYVK
jgi:hypothetical protein